VIDPLRSERVAETPIRDRKAWETRVRITEAALDLFVSRGYAETTIDQIAELAGVNRRTVFRHFATKEAILFDHLAVKRDFAMRRLAERPLSEPTLVSLHAVLRELCEQGYERPLLNQIRLVLAIDPTLAGEQLLLGFRAFEKNLVAALQDRAGKRHSPDQIVALTEMAEGWFLTAIRLYFKQGKRSLVRYFDEAVAACVQSSARDLVPLLGLDAASVNAAPDPS
jgi:AcrR family transcriptional regulator